MYVRPNMGVRLQHKLNNTELVEGSRWAKSPDKNLIIVYVYYNNVYIMLISVFMVSRLQVLNFSYTSQTKCI